MSLRPGDIIDSKYRIVRLIGEGGMGSVHEGENVRIKRRVAIKVLHKQAANNEAALLRFEREAQAAGHIGSDHILEVLDLGVLADGDRYMVMEFLDGEPLSSRIRSVGSMIPQQLVPLLRQALSGLEAAHRAGIIHRDLKPDNIFIVREKAGKTDFVKLIDFGISKFNVLGGDMAMTSTGAVMGTPYYMSPEQAKGSRSVDARSDVYSMGVIAFEALTGQVPFDGSTFNELMFKIVLAEPPQLKLMRPDVDPAFVAIVEKMMAREPDARYATSKEVMAALDAWSNAQLGVPVAAPTVVSAGPKVVPAASPAGGGMSPATVGTSSTWATSQADQIPKKSLAPLFAVGGGALLLLGGVALAIVKLSGSDAESVSASTASASVPAGAAASAVAAPIKAPEASEPKAPEQKTEPVAPPSAAASAPPAPTTSAAAPASEPASPKLASTRTPALPRATAKARESAPSAPPKTAGPSGSKAREFGY